MNLPIRSAKDIRDNKQAKEMKPTETRNPSANNRLGNCGFPRIDDTNYNLRDPQKMQMDYHHLMQEIEIMKQQFVHDHCDMIKEESWMVKEEVMMSDRALRSNHIDLSGYIDSVQRKIAHKMEILNILKNKAEYLSKKLNESEELNQKIGGCGMYDEQLLEGLPADDFGGRLF